MHVDHLSAWDAAAACAHEEWFWAVREGPDAGLVIPGSRGCLGRADLLTDPYLSRRQLRWHAEQRHGRVVLRVWDASSHQQTHYWVGWRRRWAPLPAQGVPLTAGSRLRCGQTVLELRENTGVAGIVSGLPTPSTLGHSAGGHSAGGHPTERQSAGRWLRLIPLLTSGLMLAMLVSTQPTGGGVHRVVMGMMGVSLLLSFLGMARHASDRSQGPAGRPRGAAILPSAPWAVTRSVPGMRPWQRACWRMRRQWRGASCAGWLGRDPDPAGLLVAIAALRHPDAGAPSAAPSLPGAAPPRDPAPIPLRISWRGRRDTIMLEAGAQIALISSEPSPGGETVTRTAQRWLAAQALLQPGCDVLSVPQGYAVLWPQHSPSSVPTARGVAGRVQEAGHRPMSLLLRAPHAGATLIYLRHRRRWERTCERMSERWWRTVLTVSGGSDDAEQSAELTVKASTVGRTSERTSALRFGRPQPGLPQTGLPQAVLPLAGVPHSAHSNGPRPVHYERVCGDCDRERIIAQWRQWVPHHLPARLAQVVSSPTGPLMVCDLVKDGPHALIAGTTGAGKSELVTTWVMELAAHVPPDAASFIFVDYKGGATCHALARLPHSAGVLTDQTPELTRRAVTSLQAELARRERWLADHGHRSIDDCQTGELRRLIIVVDEFAALAQDEPDLLTSLIRLAAQGRALGLHLVLATQRPHGVVSPQIRANVSLRLCLRTLDESDSYDVIDSPAAASLMPYPGQVIGRGWHVQVDAQSGPVTHAQAGALVPAQTLWCGTHEDVAAMVEEIRAAAVAEASATSSQLHGPQAWSPWAPPLPERITQEQLTPWLEQHGRGTDSSSANSESPQGGALIGLLDRPQEQRILAWQLPSAHSVSVCGTAGSGRSTALCTLLEGLMGVEGHMGEHGTYVCTATGSPLWARYHDAPQVCVVTYEYPRLVARLWTQALTGVLTTAHKPQSTIIVDDVEQACDCVDAVYGAGQGLNTLERLIRAPHLRLWASGRLRSATHPWAQACRERILLGVWDAAQAATIGVPREHVTPALPGRALRLTGSSVEHGHIALPPTIGADSPQRTRSRRCSHESEPHTSTPQQHTTPREQNTLSRELLTHSSSIPLFRPLPTQIRATDHPASIWAVGGDDAQPCQLPPTRWVIVAGPMGSGRHTAARRIAQAMQATTGQTPHIVEASRPSTPDPLMSDSLLDEDSPGIILVTTTERLSRCYHGPTSTMREHGLLVLLRPWVGPASHIAGLDLSDAMDTGVLAPGRGSAVYAGRAMPIQVVPDTLSEAGKHAHEAPVSITTAA